MREARRKPAKTVYFSVPIPWHAYTGLRDLWMHGEAGPYIRVTFPHFLEFALIDWHRRERRRIRDRKRRAERKSRREGEAPE